MPWKVHITSQPVVFHPLQEGLIEGQQQEELPNYQKG